MRQDQFERLQALEEKLIDVALLEGDPDHWPGGDLKPSEYTTQVRGDRYWCKKNAVATISLAQRIGSLVQVVRNTGAGTTPPAPGDDTDPEQEAVDSLDAEVKAAEKEAARLLKDLQSGASKQAFDKRVHGGKP